MSENLKVLNPTPHLGGNLYTWRNLYSAGDYFDFLAIPPKLRLKVLDNYYQEVFKLEPAIAAQLPKIKDVSSLTTDLMVNNNSYEKAFDAATAIWGGMVQIINQTERNPVEDFSKQAEAAKRLNYKPEYKKIQEEAQESAMGWKKKKDGFRTTGPGVKYLGHPEVELFIKENINRLMKIGHGKDTSVKKLCTILNQQGFKISERSIWNYLVKP